MYDFRNILELNTRANYVLSGDERLSSLSVKGELSNVKIYDSHNSHTCYLTLKDTTSNISCIMFESNLSALNFTPEDGLKVTVTGSLSVYAAKGSYRLIIHSMTREGQGDLAEQMRKLYEKLNKEGIFDPAHKLRLPLLPRRIGVISSSKGAVIHDIIHTLSRRLLLHLIHIGIATVLRIMITSVLLTPYQKDMKKTEVPEEYFRNITFYLIRRQYWIN